MKKRYTLIGLLLLITTLLFSQKHHTISGYILDYANGESFIGATLFAQNSNLGVTTNEYGFYSITLPAGTHEFTTSYLGYQINTFSLILRQDTTVNIELNAIAVELETVQVTAKEKASESTEIGIVRLSSKAIKEIPSFLGEPDIQQAILTQAGVSSVGEGTSGFNVRGGRTDQNLILIDEAPLYNMTHLFGLVTVVNTQSIKNLTFYKSGIPAKYGGRASSVVDIRLKEGNIKSFSGEAAINPIASKLALEFPIIKNKMNIYFSGRRSFVDLLIPLFANNDSDKFNIWFYDATLKLNYKQNDKNQFFLSGYLGRDKMSSEFEDGTEIQHNEFGWGDKLLSFRWNHIFSPKLFSNLTFYTGNYDFGFNTDGAFLNTSGTADNPLEVRTSIQSLSSKLDFSYFPTSTLQVRFGLGATNNIFESLNQIEEGKQLSQRPIEYGLEYWGYIDVETELWQRLKLRTGLRYSGWWNYGPQFILLYEANQPPRSNEAVDVLQVGANKTIKHFNNIEPRLALNLQLKENFSIKLAYDRLAQYAHLLSNTNGVIPFNSWAGSGYYLSPTTTDQYSFGIVTATKDWNAEVTLYYKKLNSLLEFRNNADLFLLEQKETVLVPAKGKSKGLEISLNKNTGKLRGFMNYTLSKSTIQTVGDWASIQINDGNVFPVNFDRPHNFNLVANYQFNKKFKLSSRLLFQSGRPITLPIGKVENIIILGDRNEHRLPINHRLDLSLEINPSKKENSKMEKQWVFSILNVYARKNAFSYFSNQGYDSFGRNSVQLKKISIIGSLIPSFSYNIRF